MENVQDGGLVATISIDDASMTFQSGSCRLRETEASWKLASMPPGTSVHTFALASSALDVGLSLSALAFGAGIVEDIRVYSWLMPAACFCRAAWLFRSCPCVFISKESFENAIARLMFTKHMTTARWALAKLTAEIIALHM